MEDESRDGRTALLGRVATLRRYWAGLDRGWRAALLGVVIVTGHQLLA
jgi:hypothetical protein